MLTVTRIDEMRRFLDVARAGGRRVGVVPTMGALHEGHLSLVRRAAEETDEVVLTVFVNPLQFAPGEDLDAYPRDLEGDTAAAAACGATTVFAPSEDEMYPRGRDRVLTSVEVPELAAVMEGTSRRTHFGGVCTVVSKLFNVVGASRAYFGEKDYQQLAIVTRMAEDLSFPVEVVGCPVVREPDGLAMSSRNVYLTDDERAEAPVLYRALRLAAAAVRSGTNDADEVRTLLRAELQTASLGRVDYVEVADPETLRAHTHADRSSRLFVAMQFGRARLIDNLSVADRAVDDTGVLDLLG